jgi:ADP-dependent NAD(P)H-hydrate dehydratase / NAD(P)H-hydrate epimerase
VTIELTTQGSGADAWGDEVLPSADPVLRAGDLDLDALARHWGGRATLSPMTAEQMRGADARAQRLGVSGDRLMEEAGIAVAAATRALARTAERAEDGPVLILAGPGNNGGDGSVAARHLANAGVQVILALVATESRPVTADGRRNWDRLAGVPGAERLHAATTRDVHVLLAGVAKASVVVDALLGTGVHGALREPIRTAVESIAGARAEGVPVLAVDTPTSVDLTSGSQSDPVVRADATVTFHRPKAGLLTRSGSDLAGRVLVAPIGIPVEADPA